MRWVLIEISTTTAGLFLKKCNNFVTQNNILEHLTYILILFFNCLLSIRENLKKRISTEKILAHTGQKQIRSLKNK